MGEIKRAQGGGGAAEQKGHDPKVETKKYKGTHNKKSNNNLRAIHLGRNGRVYFKYSVNDALRAKFVYFSFVHNYIFNNINDVRIPTKVKRQGKPIVIKVYYPSGGAPIFEFSVLSAIPRTTEGVQLDALSAQSSSKRRATRDMASRGMNAPLDRLGRPKLPKEIKSLINQYVGNDTSLQTLAGPPSHMDTVRLLPNGVGGKRFRKRRTQKAKKQNNTYKSRVYTF